MVTESRPKLIGLLALVAVVALAAVAIGRAPTAGGAAESPAAFVSAFTSDEAVAQIEGEDGVLRFDLAEDGTRFAFAAAPVFDDGLPAYGNPYITQGYIYPAGTLSESNGVLPDGSPEFPDKVLGEFSCRGWHVGDGFHSTTGPWVVSTQLYNFGGEWGDATLVSEGYMLSDVGAAIERALTGGTGPYAGARGEARGTLLGFNASDGTNVRFEVRVDGL
jgi:hypothetical protein